MAMVGSYGASSSDLPEDRSYAILSDKKHSRASKTSIPIYAYNMAAGALVVALCLLGWAFYQPNSTSLASPATMMASRSVYAPARVNLPVSAYLSSQARGVACNAVMFGHGVNDRVSKEERRKRRKLSIRKKIEGTQEKPRLSVFRSNNHIYGQIIDDSLGHTLAAAGTVEKAIKEQIADKTPKEAAEIVGKLLGERAKEKGVEKVVFDRNGYKYHGRVAAVADGAREAGLEF